MSKKFLTCSTGILFSVAMAAIIGCGADTSTTTTAPPPPPTAEEIEAQNQHYAAPKPSER
jgi:hypothetical protein